MEETQVTMCLAVRGAYAVNVLISGAGVAGPALSYWLVQYGFQVTIVEKAPALRTGGYVVDFWGAGYDIAGRIARYQEQFGPFVREKQDAAKRFAGIFAPKSRFAMFLHNQVMNLMSLGWVARLAGGSAFNDNIALPEY
jgi:2-polyprenyl-6-methoxyphenol hydroxylase-like FAD-dependent oxidoreductase